MRKCAVITGIYGQDGSLLAEHLLAKNYRVVCLVQKKRDGFPTLESAEIVETDIANSTLAANIFKKENPDEFYHLAAAHHSSEMSSEAEIRAAMLRTNFLSTQVILDALMRFSPNCRFLYAGSSQMYTAQSDITVVTEKTPYCPSSYYGFTKVASAQLIDFMRREQGLWGQTAILFNHESTRRPVQFISRKITTSVAALASSSNMEAEEKLKIRDITARADWSAASDFIQAMHLSLQNKTAADFILASGKVHAVRDLLEIAFSTVGLAWQDHVISEQKNNVMPRPCLQGQPSRLQELANWTPKQSFRTLVEEMMEHDLTLQDSPKRDKAV